MRFFVFTFFLLFIILANGYGQNHVVDSLKKQLSLHQQEDTLRVKLFLQLSSDETYDHPTVAGNYAMEAKALAEKLNYQEGLALAYRAYGLSVLVAGKPFGCVGQFFKGN